MIGKRDGDVDLLRVSVQALPSELDVVSVLNRTPNRALESSELAPQSTR